MTNITTQQLTDWYVLYRQIFNGYHISNTDKSELIRLNHLIMSISDDIHKKNMMGEL